MESVFDSLVHQRQLLPGRYLKHLNLAPEEYLQHLTKVVLEIGEETGGVNVARGKMKVRIVAPLEMRMDYIANILDISTVRAKLLILQREADRKACAKHYFKADIDDPAHYDVIVNMDHFALDEAIEMVLNAWRYSRARGDGECNPPKRKAAKGAKKPAKKAKKK